MARTNKRFRAAGELFRCPLCHTPMAFRDDNSLVCQSGHCYDLSKYGYLNFLSGGARTQYTKELFLCRRRVFADGFYAPVMARLAQLVKTHGGARPTVLDAGCGEGFWLAALQSELPEMTALGVDNVKDAVLLAAKADRETLWLAGDLANLPLQDGSVDVILNIFAPANYAEFSRVLRPDGVVIKIAPDEGYLRELRACAGEQLASAGHSGAAVQEHFERHMQVSAREHVRYTLPLTPQQAADFAEMTPLLSNIDRAALDLDGLREITIDVDLVAGRPRK